MTRVCLSTTREFLDRLDAAATHAGFVSRSEFVRYVLGEWMAARSI